MMNKFQRFFSTSKGRVIAATLTAAILISAVIVGLTFTLGSNNDVEKDFVCQNSYNKIALGSELNTYSGVYRARSNHSEIASVRVSGGNATVVADAANTGVASIALFTMVGDSAFLNYQIYDPSGAAGYRIPDGKLVIAKVTDETTPL
ncbi:MAG: hypothetical protein LBB91_05535, partial [Clostridiales bacterium]|nr:hypothetical protein [Clostridiales bacterium]